MAKRNEMFGGDAAVETGLQELQNATFRAGGGISLKEGDVLLLPSMDQVKAGLGLRKTDMDGIKDSRTGEQMYFIESLCARCEKTGPNTYKETDKLVFVPTGTFSRQVRSVDSNCKAVKTVGLKAEASFTHGSSDPFSSTLRGGGAILPTWEAALAAIAPHNGLKCVKSAEIAVKDFNQENAVTSRVVYQFEPVTVELLPAE